MIGLGALSGLLVWVLSGPDSFWAWVAAGYPLAGAASEKLWVTTGSGVFFTSGMWSTLLIVRGWLARHLPLRTWRSGAVHMLVLCVVMEAVFFGLYYADSVVCTWIQGPGSDLHDGPPLTIIGTVAFGFTAICVSVMYAFDFYRRARAAEQAAVLAELSALRAQIDPHFLFNTLNAIAALVRTRPEEAEGVTERLADLFRYTLRASKQPASTLADEVGAARLYAEIEQVRFRDRMEVVWEIAPDAQRAALPSLTLQPLVENAVKHGVARTEGACAVLIRARRDGDTVELTVRDTGPGFDLAAGDEVFARGTGLANVRDRQRLHFGAGAAFELLPDGVRLRFPYWAKTDLSTRRAAPLCRSGHERGRAAPRRAGGRRAARARADAHAPGRRRGRDRRAGARSWARPRTGAAPCR